MSHVLVSYKRENEQRVARLIRALQQHGLIIWWDQGLPGGEEWRANIHDALESAGCVIVVWSEASVGPEGGFVRDEATRAKARGVLVPVRIDKVDPPLGFGELQAIDLTHWKSNPNDPFLLDVVAACRAKLAGEPAPPAVGPAQRVLRRARAGIGAAALMVAGVVFATNLFHVQNAVCSVGGAGMSDACGALGLGERPRHDERLAWAALTPGSCPDLRQFVSRFKGGVYAARAAQLLGAAQVARAARPTPVVRTLAGYVRQSEAGFASQARASDDARARAQKDASASVCTPHDGEESLERATLASFTPDCRKAAGGGWTCAADYRADCRMLSRELTETCR